MNIYIFFYLTISVFFQGPWQANPKIHFGGLQDKNSQDSFEEEEEGGGGGGEKKKGD